ncbi:MAG: cell division ATPase MinD [Candidatus Aenigmarchaeota archaeon]|nr:cell division ATPase MinD [Candidatus Aenigmarchaeota archaeon]
MSKIFAITSGKGGVGKTTLTANLATLLSKLGKDVLAIDGNFTTPNLGLQLGMYLPEYTIHDILAGKADVPKSVYYHPLGFKIIPGSLNIEDMRNVDPERFVDVVKQFDSDYILVDTAAGLGKEAIYGIEASDKVLLVTTPDTTSLSDAARTERIAYELNKEIVGVVLNMVPKRIENLAIKKASVFLESPVVATLPEDPKVRECNNLKIPMVERYPNSRFSIELKKFAYSLAGYEYSEEIKFDLLSRFLSWLLR